MTKRTVWAVVVILVAVAAAVMLASSGSPSSGQRGAPASALPPAPTRASPARQSSAEAPPATPATIEAPDLEPTPGELVGRALHRDGRPFRGTVALIWWHDEHGSAETDEHGRFRIAHRDAAQRQLVARSGDGFRATGPTLWLPHDQVVRFVVDAGARTLRVSVRDGDTGAAVTGAAIEHRIRSVPWPRRVAARTDDTGDAVLRTAEAVGSLEVSADGFLTRTFDVPADKSSVVVRLARAARIVGRLCDAGSGGTVAGMDVIAVGGMGTVRDRTPELRAVADDHGRFTIEGVTPGLWTVFAVGDGWATVSIGKIKHLFANNPFAVHIDGPGNVERDILVQRLQRVPGVVVDEGGNVVPGAVVTASQTRDTWRGFASRVPAAVSDEDGRFRITAAADGELSLRAEAPGYLSGLSGHVGADDRQSSITIRVSRARTARLTVVTTDGSPVPGATVKVIASGDRVVYGVGDYVADAAGVVEATGLPARTLWADIRARGHVWQQVQFDTTDGDIDLPVTLESAQTLRGTLEWPPELGSLTWVELRVKTAPDATEQRYASRMAEVSPDGEFLVDTLPEGRYLLTARAMVRDAELVGDAELAGDAELVGDAELAGDLVAATGGESLALSLLPQPGADPGSAVRVRVLDPNGRPVESATARVSWIADEREGSATGSVHAGVLTARTERTVDAVHVEVWDARDAAGRPLAAARTRLESVPLAGQIRLDPERRLRGRVVDQTGDPVVGHPLRIHEAERRTRNETKLEIAVAWTDRSGRFDIRGLGRTPIELSSYDVAGFEPLPRRIITPGVQDLEIVLQRGGVVVITVLGPDGEPVDDARIRVSSTGSLRSFRASTGPDGRAVIEGPVPGEQYELEVDAGFGPQKLREISLREWSAADTTITLETAHTFVGTVVDSEGQPVYGAYVWWLAGGAERRSVQTYESGMFVIPQQTTRELDVAVTLDRASGIAGTAPTTRIHEDQRARLEIDTGLRITVKAEGWPGGFYASHIALYDRRTEQTRRRQVGPHNPIVSFLGLKDDRRYDVFVSGPGGEQHHFPDVRAEGQTLLAKPNVGGTISGRILLDGTPPDCFVAIHVRSGAVTLRGSRNATGRFVVKGLPEGTWTVEAEFAGEGLRYSGRATAATGGEVDIHLKAD